MKNRRTDGRGCACMENSDVYGMKTLSLDIRKRIVACYDTHKYTRDAIAQRFCVSLGMVKKLLRQRRAIGEIGDLYHRAGRKPMIGFAWFSANGLFNGSV